MHEVRDIPELVAEVVGHLAQAGIGLVAVLLGGDGLHHGGDHGLVGLAQAGEQVALKVNPASLPAWAAYASAYSTPTIGSYFHAAE